MSATPESTSPARPEEHGPAEPAPATPAPRAARPRRRRPRWILRICLLLLALLALAAAAVQIVLFTDLPRQIVLQKLEHELGLRASAASLQTGWAGHTTLTGVSFAMPLASKPLFTADEIRVDHTILPALLVGRKLRIRSLTAVHPSITITQSASGQWNLQELADRLVHSPAAVDAAAESKPASPPVLPAVRISGGTLHLLDNTGRSATIEGLKVSADPVGALAWAFHVSAAPYLDVRGRLAPGQGWKHEADITVGRLSGIISPWIADAPPGIALTGTWHGQVDGDTLKGTLDLQKAHVQPVSVTGQARLQISPDTVLLSPRMHVSGVDPGPAQITRGTVTVRGTRITARDLTVHALGGAARLDGWFDWSSTTAQVDAAWEDITLPGDIRQRGEAHASLAMPFADRPQLRLDLTSHGAAPPGSWNAHLLMNGQGRSWTDIDWNMTFPELTVLRQSDRLALDGLTARVSLNSRELRLTELALPAKGRLAASGKLDLHTRQWSARLDGRDIPLPRISPLTIGLSAEGTDQQIALSKFDLKTGTVTVTGSGSYVPRRAVPLDATIQLTRPPLMLQDPSGKSIAGGELRGQAHATGTLQPLAIQIESQVTGQDVFAGKRKLGNIAIQINGSVDNTHASLHSRELKLLEGQWTLHGTYHFDSSDALIGLDVRNLPLAQADGLVAPPPKLKGMLKASLALDIPRGNVDLWRVGGDWEIADLQRDKLHLDKLAGKIALANRVVTVSDVSLAQGTGRGTAALRYDLARPTSLAVTASLQKWPVEKLPHALALSVTASTKLDVDLKKRSAVGPAEVSGQVLLKDRPLGTFAISAQVQQREVDVPKLHLAGFEGVADGHAHVILDDLLKSSANLKLTGLSASALAGRWPAAAGLAGTLDGTMVAGKNTDPKSDYPLRVAIKLQPQNIQYNGLALGAGTMDILVGRADLKFAPLPDRILLDQSSFDLAGGKLGIWGRLSTDGTTMFSMMHTQVQFKGLDMNQFAHAADPKSKPIAGRLAGQITIFGPVSDYKLLDGSANIRLTKSDLGNTAIIGAFYNALHLQANPREPQGTGNAAIRFDDGAVILTNGRYTMTGLDVRGYGEMTDVFKGLQSPISGSAVGSARPLKDINLPLVGEADAILTALQGSATTFRVGGTVAEPVLTSESLAEMSDSLRRFIVGEVEESHTSGGSAPVEPEP